MTDTAEQVKFPGPDEIEGFWAFDKMHAPRPLHPLSQDLVMSTLAVGFTKAQAEYDCPIVASNQAINHYFYMAFHPHPDEAVVEDRMSPLPRHARQEGAPRRQALDERVAAA